MNNKRSKTVSALIVLLLSAIFLLNSFYASNYGSNVSAPLRESLESNEAVSDFHGQSGLGGKSANSSSNKFVSDEFIVGAKPEFFSNMISFLEGRHFKIVREMDAVHAVLVKVPKSCVDSFESVVSSCGFIDYFEQNKIIALTDVQPNDPYWSEQYGPQRIQAPNAWTMENGSRNILVAIVDTGVDYNHLDLKDNYVAGGFDWVNCDDDPMDDHGHGTHCAGIVAAARDNGIGIAGLANVSFMAEKILNASGYGTVDGAVSGVIDAVDFGLANFSHVIISCSWGTSEYSQALRDAFKYASDRGALLIAAAGNSNSDQRWYPAAFPEVISVTSTDENDARSFFSSYGETVELSAPGQNIYSTYLNNSYTRLSGTSMACPHVAGVAALVWSRFPNYTRDQVRYVLQSTSVDLGSYGWDQCFGYGRVNASKAVGGVGGFDVAVTGIEGPSDFLEPNVPVMINFSVYGVEADNVSVQFLVNGSVVDSASFSGFTNDSFVRSCFNWTTPAVKSLYNLTVYAVLNSSEQVKGNNFRSVNVRVTRLVSGSISPKVGQFANGVVRELDQNNLSKVKRDIEWFNFSYLNFTSPDLVNVSQVKGGITLNASECWMSVNVTDRWVEGGTSWWTSTYFIYWLPKTVELGDAVPVWNSIGFVVDRENLLVNGSKYDVWVLSADVSSISGNPHITVWFDVNTGCAVRWIITGIIFDNIPPGASGSTEWFMVEGNIAKVNQFYLTVQSSYGEVSGEGWYDADSTAYASLSVGEVDCGNGTRRVFVGWGGDASGGNLTSDPIIMNESKTAVANWKTQLKLIVASAHGSPIPCVGEHWYDYGELVTANVTSPVVEDGMVYVCIGWNGSGSVPLSGFGCNVSFSLIEPSNITWLWSCQFTLCLREGWNMVSLCGRPDNSSWSSILNGVGFYRVLTWEDGGYVDAVNAEVGRGYWVLVLADFNVTYMGAKADGSLTLHLEAGWSLIGVPFNATIANPDDNPDGSVWGHAYMWNGSMYVGADELSAGYGYWVLAWQNCTLTLYAV